MAVYTETVELEDKISPAAKAAAEESKTLQAALDSVNKSLIKASAMGDIAGYRKLTKDSETLTAALGSIDKGMLKEADAAEKAAAAHKKLGDGSKQLGDDMATQEAILGGMASAALAVAAAIGVLVVAFGAVVLKGALFAIEATEGKQAALSLWTALGQGKIKGAEVDEMLDSMRDKLGVTKDAMAPFMTEFLKMGITGEASLEKLTTAAVSAEALVKGGGQAFVNLTRQINAAAESGAKLTIPYKKFSAQLATMGLNIDDVAKSMNLTSKQLTEGLKAGTIDAGKLGVALENVATSKGKGPLENMALSSSNLIAMLKESVGDLFEDFAEDIKPFMIQVKSLFSILGGGLASGKAAKAGIGGFFKEVFALATKVVPMVKHFLLDLVILGLKGYIALKPIAKAIREWVQSAEGQEKIAFTLDIIVKGFKVLGVVAAVVVGLVVVLAAVLLGLQIAIVAVGFTMMAFATDAAKAFIGFIESAPTIAMQFVDGLVKGITDGAQRVIDAAKGLATGAKNAVTGALGIKSPSTVMMALGDHTATGFAEGISGGAGEVQSASNSMVNASVSGASSAPSGAAAAPAAAAPSGGAQISVVVQIDGAGKSALEITEEMVAQVFARMALQAGV